MINWQAVSGPGDACFLVIPLQMMIKLTSVIDGVTDDRCSRINCVVYWAMLSAQIQPNSAEVIRKSFKMQTYDDPKHTAKTTTPDFLKAEKRDGLQRPS